ncbi:MAG TPA: cytochrome c-type biogenesis CcmF C-terminal domain-containing protein [Nocardioidaceae bacterium]|jgi:cytochrome c-type biogenesis protein CcmF|nr:cytochrome c-type biogenesis CcmF C-terminal domain-containing protein [Nocardioidaceae bacterium]
MIAWLGTFALALGFSAALASVALWAWAATHEHTSVRAARWGVGLFALGAVVAVVAVEWALVTHDFALSFVAENGSRSEPLYYTITSLWSAHDGSMLLWVLVLSGYATVVAMRPPRPGVHLHRWAMTVLSAVTAFFFGLALFTGGVFQTVVPTPADGPGPNPLLQDHPAMGIHPPLLYLGLIGMVVPFAYAIAGLITGDLSRRWLVSVRRYTTVAWVALTAGIVMGAWWSYAVLGWGGYWAWDPVENASLMPWLVATALIHSSMVQRHNGALPVWNMSLAVSTFMLSCLGTFLTRSGVVVSVHSFADSAVGPLLLGFLAALAVGVVALVVLRVGRLSEPRPTGAALSRGSALVLNNVLLVVLALTVLLGTLLPLVADVATHQQLSVGPPYFNRMAVPVALLLVGLMALGPVVRWHGEDPMRLVRQLAGPVLAGGVVVAVVAATTSGGATALATFGLATVAAGSVLAEYAAEVRRTHAGHAGGWPSTVRVWAVRHRSRNSGLLVHLGVAVLAVGVAASSTYTTSVQRTLAAGDQATVGGVHAALVSTSRARDARDMSTAARIRLTGDGNQATVTPALRFFPAHDMTVTSPAIVNHVTGDVYVTLLAVDQKGSTATIRLAVNPLVGWIWAGGAIMVAGALLALWSRRRQRIDPVPEGAQTVLVPEPERARQ